MDTAQLDVDVNPSYIRVVCKDKLTQMRLPYDVNVTETKVQRSKATGVLKVTMP